VLALTAADGFDLHPEKLLDDGHLIGYVRGFDKYRV
jgi:hypothetical protein